MEALVIVENMRSRLNAVIKEWNINGYNIRHTGKCNLSCRPVLMTRFPSALFICQLHLPQSGLLLFLPRCRRHLLLLLKLAAVLEWVLEWVTKWQRNCESGWRGVLVVGDSRVVSLMIDACENYSARNQGCVIGNVGVAFHFFSID